jgi:glucose/arabinose dehydrogenase
MIAPVLAAAVALAIPAAQGQQQLSVRPFATGLAELTSIASTPAEPRRLYAVEQVGRIRYFVNGRLRGTFLDLRERVVSGGEQGLLSVAFHPAYARNHRFYVNYTDRRGDTRVVEFRSRRGRGVKSTARQLLFVRQPYANHNGGQLKFDRNGLLYVGMGDGGAGGDPGNRAQRMNERLGKLLRTNPLRRPVRWEIVALGLRNPWRFTFDRANGDLYIADVGQNAWEEIDYRPSARIGTLANYGWKVFEGRERFSDTALGPGDLVAPVHVYGREGGHCSVTGGYVYRGRAVPAARGRYFFGDYCSGVVWSLRIDDGRAVDVRREPFRANGLTSFGEDVRGELYLATGDGRILKLGR